MNVLWIAALALFVLAEKAVPAGGLLGRAGGVALILWGGVTLSRRLPYGAAAWAFLPRLRSASARYAGGTPADAQTTQETGLRTEVAGHRHSRFRRPPSVRVPSAIREVSRLFRRVISHATEVNSNENR
jgi:hypothetical protein